MHLSSRLAVRLLPFALACSASTSKTVGGEVDPTVLASLGTATGPFDLDGDGHPDGTGIDTNRDGRPDGLGVDTDGDDVYDAIDTDGDGRADAPRNPPGGSGSGGFTVDVGGGGLGGTIGGRPSGPVHAVTRPELWYSSGDRLVYFELDAHTGGLLRTVGSVIPGLPRGQDSLTMLPNGALVGARSTGGVTTFYSVSSPPREPTTVIPSVLGVMPGGIQIEGLYTDCEGRIYAMDTGVNDNSAEGNRLLRFIGDLPSGSFDYEVVTNLDQAMVADIDDLGPGIALDDTTITDNRGLAIDTGTLYDFDYTAGTGTKAGRGGTFGVHALGGALFEDALGRVYVLDSSAQLYLYDRKSQRVSATLGQGPEPTPGTSSARAPSALTGPLTDCVSGFPPVVR